MTGDTVKEVGIKDFKFMVERNLQRTEQSVIDKNIKDWFKKYQDEFWGHATKRIREEIEPSMWKPKENIKLTGICLGSVDKPKFTDDGRIDGIKENVVTHCIMRDDDIIQITDRGTPDITYGNEYVINTVSGEGQNEKRWYNVDENNPPNEIKKYDDDEIMVKLNKLAKDITDLENGEIAVVKVKMTHNIRALQDQPFFELNEDGISLRMQCSGQQYVNEVVRYISFFVNPQKFGTQHFRGMFSDHFYTSLKNAENDEKAEHLIRDWIVPEGDLDTFVVGRVKASKNNDGELWYSMSPVYMMMLDMSSFEIAKYVESQKDKIEEPTEIKQHHRDFYLKEVEMFDGKVDFDTLVEDIQKVRKWKKDYIEEITNDLLDRGDICEPVLGTITLNISQSKGVEDKGGIDDKGGGESLTTPTETPLESKSEISIEVLQSYLGFNPRITKEGIEEFGYKVDEKTLEVERLKMYPPTVTHTTSELKAMTKAELVEMCEKRELNTKGKKEDLIKRIMEA